MAKGEGVPEVLPEVLRMCAEKECKAALARAEATPEIAVELTAYAARIATALIELESAISALRAERDRFKNDAARFQRRVSRGGQ